MEGTVME